MLNNQDEAILKQEHGRLNKPHLLIKISQNRELTARDKKVYNIFLRELLNQNLKEIKTNEIRLSISQVSKLLGVTTRNKLYDSIENLMNTIITFEEDYTQDWSEKMPKLMKTRAVMISSYSRPVESLLEYDNEDPKDNNNLVIRFDTRLTSKIIEHHKYYAKLDLLDLTALKVSHSLTLYELFITALGKNTYQKKNLTEEQIRGYLHLKDKYHELKEFNNKVIKKSINEINKKTKITVSYERTKENKINIYRFKINLDIKHTFNRFRATIINNEVYRNNRLKYKNVEYVLTKDMDDKKAQYLITNARTYKTIQKEKAEEIWGFMYELLSKDSTEFAYKFIIYKDLDLNDFNRSSLSDDELNQALEEWILFQDYYDKTI